jgi:hypothetical protein
MKTKKNIESLDEILKKKKNLLKIKEKLLRYLKNLKKLKSYPELFNKKPIIQKGGTDDAVKLWQKSLPSFWCKFFYILDNLQTIFGALVIFSYQAEYTDWKSNCPEGVGGECEYKLAPLFSTLFKKGINEIARVKPILEVIRDTMQAMDLSPLLGYDAAKTDGGAKNYNPNADINSLDPKKREKLADFLIFVQDILDKINNPTGKDLKIEVLRIVELVMKMASDAKKLNKCAKDIMNEKNPSVAKISKCPSASGGEEEGGDEDGGGGGPFAAAQSKLNKMVEDMLRIPLMASISAMPGGSLITSAVQYGIKGVEMAEIFLDLAVVFSYKGVRILSQAFVLPEYEGNGDGANEVDIQCGIPPAFQVFEKDGVVYFRVGQWKEETDGEKTWKKDTEGNDLMVEIPMNEDFFTGDPDGKPSAKEVGILDKLLKNMSLKLTSDGKSLMQILEESPALVEYFTNEHGKAIISDIIDKKIKKDTEKDGTAIECTMTGGFGTCLNEYVKNGVMNTLDMVKEMVLKNKEFAAKRWQKEKDQKDLDRVKSEEKKLEKSIANERNRQEALLQLKIAETAKGNKPG